MVAHDLHPEYLSTKYARELDDVELVGVQHHHAHIASCLADNGATGPVIGVALDGLGYGTDGTIWGGEFLLADLTGYRRLGHLDPVPMPGGAAAIRQPWRMAAAHLAAAFPDGPPAGLDVVAPPRRPVGRRHRHGPQRAQRPADVQRGPALRRGRGAPRHPRRDQLRGSGGDRAGATRRLARTAAPTRRACATATRSGCAAPTSSAPSSTDLLAGVAAGVVAARFHNGLAAAVVAGCLRARESPGSRPSRCPAGCGRTCCCSTAAVDALEAAGFTVLVHHRVPTNDGGISLGQAAVAAART